MNYRTLGQTGLEISEIGLGGEWLERHNTAEVKAVIDRCAEAGINILDCWMSEPNVRSNIGAALEDSVNAGSSRDTSVPHGRTANMCAHATLIKSGKRSRIFWIDCAQIILTWA